MALARALASRRTTVARMAALFQLCSHRFASITGSNGSSAGWQRRPTLPAFLRNVALNLSLYMVTRASAASPDAAEAFACAVLLGHEKEPKPRSRCAGSRGFGRPHTDVVAPCASHAVNLPHKSDFDADCCVLGSK